MTEHFWAGMAVILLGGILNGSFPLPMSYARTWRWENTWLVFTTVSLLLLPWILAIAFVTDLGGFYASLPGGLLFYPILFGFVWGFAQFTFGLGLKALGMALAFPIVAGLVALVGSLVPLLILSPADLFRARGILLMVSIPILLAGLVFYAKAGLRRESELRLASAAAGAAQMSFMAGLAITIFAGVFGPFWNLGFALSGDIIRKSLEWGGSPVTANYPVWAPVLTAGFIPNLGYCAYLLFRNRTWGLFGAAGALREAGLAVAMALLWLSGIVVYGIGANMVGVYGTSLGFALFASVLVLTSNTLGVLAGEWKGTSAGARRLLTVGMGVIVIAVVVLSLGGLF